MDDKGKEGEGEVWWERTSGKVREKCFSVE